MNLRKIVFILCVASIASFLAISAVAGMCSLFWFPLLLAIGTVLYLSGVLFMMIILMQAGDITLSDVKSILLSWISVILILLFSRV